MKKPVKLQIRHSWKRITPRLECCTMKPSNTARKMQQWLTSKVNDLDILMAEIIAREVDTIDVIRKKHAE